MLRLWSFLQNVIVGDDFDCLRVFVLTTGASFHLDVVTDLLLSGHARALLWQFFGRDVNDLEVALRVFGQRVFQSRRLRMMAARVQIFHLVDR